MATGSRKWWIVHTAAGVAAVLLMVFGVSQCSNKNAERSENDDLKKSVVRSSAALDSARATVERVRNVNEYLVRDNRAKADTIKMQRDSIIVLNDSLDVVNKKLVDCRNSKKKKQVPVKTKPQPKPVVKPQPAKPQPKDTVVIVLDNTKKCNDDVRVELDNSKNSGNIVVSKNPCQGTEVVLKNGAVNNGNIVVGDNNNVVINNNVIADTLNQMKQHQAAYGYIRVKRVYRVK
ncbi:MAG: hypothetical protein E7011_01940 [Alphaproteobacteria bacterium]|nr:hypothetical protein [Alphaproteobacteria bacterium]